MGWYGDGAWGWGGWLAMTLAMVAFWSLVVFAVVAIFRGTGERRSDGRIPPQDAMEILRERLARGEIGSEEYRTRADVLRGTPAG